MSEIPPAILARLLSTEAARLRRLLARTPKARRHRVAARFVAHCPPRGRAPWLID